jgi:hypothetical protein
MRWILGFAGLCIGIIAVIVVLIWAFDVFGGLGLDVHGKVALGLGIVFTTLLAAGLMALVFYSSRSGRD